MADSRNFDDIEWVDEDGEGGLLTQTVPVVAFMVKLFCPTCRPVEMEPVAQILHRPEKQHAFPHTCPKCGYTVAVRGQPFPRIKWMEAQ